MSSGIFSLNEAHNEQVTGDWSTASDVWLIGSPVVSEQGSPYGYFAGAKDPGGTAERLDYKNDSGRLLSQSPREVPINTLIPLKNIKNFESNF